MAKRDNKYNNTRNGRQPIPNPKQTKSVPKSSLVNQLIPQKEESSTAQPTPEVKSKPIDKQIHISQKASASISNIPDILNSNKPPVEQPKVDAKQEHNPKIKEENIPSKVSDKQSSKVEKVSKKKSKAKKQSKESTTAQSAEQMPKTSLKESATSSSTIPNKLIQQPTIPESTTEVAIQKELAGPPAPTLYGLSKHQKRSLKKFLEDTNPGVDVDSLSKITAENLKQLGVNFTVNNSKIRLKLKPKLNTSATDTVQQPSVKNPLTDKLFTPVENPGIKTDGWGVIKDSQFSIKGPNSPLTSNVANNTNATTSQTITNASENSSTSGVDNNTKIQGPKPNSSSNTGTSQTGTNTKASANNLEDVKVPKTLGVLDSIKQEVQVVKDAYLDKEAKQIAKNLKIKDPRKIARIRDQLEHDPLGKQNLDKKVFNKGVKDSSSLSKLLGGDAGRKAFETKVQEALDKGYITKEGARHLSSRDVRSLIKGGLTEAVKESKSSKINKLTGWGSQSGYSHSLKAAQNSNMLQRAYALGSTAMSFRSFGEATLNSLGLDTRAQKAAMAGKGGIMGFLGATMNPAMGLISVGYAFQQEDPLNEFLAQTMMTSMATQGWRIGKAAANVLTPVKTLGKLGHIPRILSGGVLGGVLGAVGYGSFKAIGDLSKAESNIAHMAKKFSKKDSMVNHNYTRESLSLRQAALQKLSSSSLNNRGQLLGSEATILRGGWSYGSGQDSM